jgi:hypothetical protein
MRSGTLLPNGRRWVRDPMVVVSTFTTDCDRCSMPVIQRPVSAFMPA